MKPIHAVLIGFCLPETSAYKPASASRVSNSVDNNPPTTTVARGRWTSDPMPLARAAGTIPMQVGVMGFGSHHRIHRKRLFGVSDDRPVTIIVVDEEAKLRKAIPEIRPLVKEGLLLLSDVGVII